MSDAIPENKEIKLENSEKPEKTEVKNPLELNQENRDRSKNTLIYFIILYFIKVLRLLDEKFNSLPNEQDSENKLNEIIEFSMEFKIQFYEIAKEGNICYIKWIYIHF